MLSTGSPNAPIDDFMWDTQNPNNGIMARIGFDGFFPINGSVSFSPDGKSIWFNFDPIQIPMDMGPASTPITLDITKYLKYTGPTFTSGGSGSQDYIDIVVNEFPTTPEPGSIVLFGLGAVGLCYGYVRRKRTAIDCC